MALIWGTIRVITDRSLTNSYSEYILKSGVSTWAFGQVIAVILLLLPLISFCEAIYGKSYAMPCHGRFSLNSTYKAHGFTYRLRIDKWDIS